ncbi:LacI family DNA-binding transcriptional regulator [Streptomyces sp. DSM 40750]|uniref:LacI family DNA-binding transcriptional regulator n=1 Tax=Streptomyces sp. DSM 40750 TaxID=2801030 RepID=UPI00214CD9CD|nr:LacI family DNA-binding transcriptional regulator [Streptomyces sp. DSM 40750]UUU19421.1 LacI family transcriptional regulator [Streptomyces sp. DSM 40750]UUU27235.1 LacI family transcriptional regulator [Streptomyces sp. DSM 40750]
MAPRSGRVTSADVAREAGVSRATVSFVLNNTQHQKITDATRQRVLAAAEKLGYAPSAAARTLRYGRSDVVLGLLPDWPLGYAAGQLIQELTLAFAKRNLTFVVHSGIRGARSLSEIWKALTPAAVLSFEPFSEPDAAAMRAVGIEVVAALYDGQGLGSDESITSANAIGAAQARHLAASHRRLGYAYPDDERVAVFARPRLDGVRKVCAELGLPEPDVRTIPLTPRDAADAVRSWLAADPRVTGICAFNDDVAMSVLAGLRHLGLEAPRDMAVIGVDNSPAAAVSHPPLTSVVQDLPGIAELYADSVWAALDGAPASPNRVEPHIRLEVRDSA